MTVEYVPGRRLMLHVTGTVIPEASRTLAQPAPRSAARPARVLQVAGMCVFTCALALGLCFVYNPIRKEVREGGKKTLLYHIFYDCDAFWAMLTTFVTFVLGFFNSNVFQRWWRLRELCGTVNGKTVDTAVLLASYVKSEKDLNDLIRILWLAHALHVQSVATQRTSDADVIRRLRSEDLIQGNVSAMRGAASDCLMYLSTPVPLAYTHLVEMMVTIYVLMAPIGLVSRLLWMAVPSCFIVTLIFYGFMCVGKQMLNPFDSHRSDSFETNAFLRGTRMACLEVIASVHNYQTEDRNSAALDEDSSFGGHIPPRAASISGHGTQMLDRHSKGRDSPGLFIRHLCQFGTSMQQSTEKLEGNGDTQQSSKASVTSPMITPRDSPLLSAAELPLLPKFYAMNDESIFGHC